LVGNRRVAMASADTRPPLPRDPNQVCANLEVRRRIQELGESTAEPRAECAASAEVHSLLETDVRSLEARLQVPRAERAALEAQLEQEAARVPAIEEEILELERFNAAGESEVHSLEQQAMEAQQALAELASTLAAHREQRTRVRVSLSGALGSLVHLEHRLRENAADSKDGPGDEE
jgi:chromosome segregation ATPase